MEHLWDVVAEAELSVAEQAQLAQREHGCFALGEAAHALCLLHGVQQGVQVVVRSGGCRNLAGARLHFFLPWGNEVAE